MNKLMSRKIPRFGDVYLRHQKYTVFFTKLGVLKNARNDAYLNYFVQILIRGLRHVLFGRFLVADPVPVENHIEIFAIGHLRAVSIELDDQLFIAALFAVRLNFPLILILDHDDRRCVSGDLLTVGEDASGCGLRRTDPGNVHFAANLVLN